MDKSSYEENIHKDAYIHYEKRALDQIMNAYH